MTFNLDKIGGEQFKVSITDSNLKKGLIVGKF